MSETNTILLFILAIIVAIGILILLWKILDKYFESRKSRSQSDSNYPLQYAIFYLFSGYVLMVGVFPLIIDLLAQSANEAFGWNIKPPIENEVFGLIAYFFFCTAVMGGMYIYYKGKHFDGNQKPLPQESKNTDSIEKQTSTTKPKTNKEFTTDSIILKLPKMNSTKQVFIIHDSKDLKYLDALERQLSILEKRNVIKSWNTGNIVAGSNVKESIEKKLKAADIVLLLISADYLYSDDCQEIQQEAQTLGKYLIPVILRSCMWDIDESLSKLDARPKFEGELKPVSSWNNQDNAFEDVARGIYQAVKKLKTQSPQNRTSISISKPSFNSNVKMETLKQQLKTKKEILESYRAELRQLEKSLSETEKYETRLRKRLNSNIEDVKESIQKTEEEIQNLENQIGNL